MITLTDIAISKIKEISDDEGIGHYTIRLKVLGQDCAGFTNDMTFDDQASDMDELIIINDIKVIVDPISFQYLDGVKIDYLDSSISAGFKFVGQDITGSCGCGNSYSI
jgi:iron-sulfur cluster insertion protein